VKPADSVTPYEQSVLITYGQRQSTSDDYYTPEWIFDALGLRFDLDVCAPPGGVEWVPAERYFSAENDGLSQPWTGRVWMNPPYSNVTPWVDRFIDHGQGIALVCHAKSYWHPKLWAAADGVVIPDKVIDAFVGGRCHQPVWFAAFGEECVDAIGHLGVVRERRP
jgi:DNA N-6-adenine-methyltransferase (Dam)